MPDWVPRVCIAMLLVMPAACSSERVPSESASVVDADDTQDAAFQKAYDAGFASSRDASDEAPAVEDEAAERAAFDRAFVSGFSSLSALDVPDLAGFVEGSADRTLTRTADRLGLMPSTLPASNALLMIAGWEAVHDRDIPADEAAAIHVQVQDSLRRNPPAAYMSNAQEWRLARSYSLLAAVLFDARAQRRGDTREMTQLRDIVLADFKRQTGMDLAAIHVGRAGFQ